MAIIRRKEAGEGGTKSIPQRERHAEFGVTTKRIESQPSKKKTGQETKDKKSTTRGGRK